MIDTFGDNLLEGFEYESPSHEGNQFKDFLCVLEGFKTKFKNLHWSAYSNSIHVRIDELIDEISDYQDILAEEVQGIQGQLEPNFLKGTNFDFTCPHEAIDNLISRTDTFYTKLPQSSDFAGVRSECEAFITNLHKYRYLFELCRKGAMD